MSGLPIPGPDELLFVPLGGSGEIGMNLNLYGYAGRWIMIDCGVTFRDEQMPEADVVMPDIRALEGMEDRIEAIVLTHAHEDHHGAVHHLWPRLRCPVLATPFAATLLREKLSDAGLREVVPVDQVAPGDSRQLGDFRVEYVPITHSIPESHAIALTTPAGVVLHTGDWKFDPRPGLGPTTDEARLRQLGDAGVLAITGDSTNALVAGESGSEGDIADELVPLVDGQEGLVAVATFASNVARLRTVAEVAQRCGRRMALVGRSLWRLTDAARTAGYLDGIPAFVKEDAIRSHPRRELLVACTGSQGEPRAALSRIIERRHRALHFAPGDRVIFSSRVIPGNEIAVKRIWNGLTELGCDVITSDQAPIHVSGHPARDELTRMYHCIRPRIALPVHGEPLHIRAHATLARSLQVPEVFEPRNGRVIRLAPGAAAEAGRVDVGRLVLDGAGVVPRESDHLQARRRMAYHGAVTVTMVVEDDEVLVEPRVTLHGLDPAGSGARVDIAETVLSVWDGLPASQGEDDGQARAVLEKAVRRTCRRSLFKRPDVVVELIRLRD
ncbi:MAG: ribonuclease J [Rhodospirillales bacterium]|nr:ribonuclease J [Rhodospirillales bacterium]